jgi:hypothetical protein
MRRLSTAVVLTGATLIAATAVQAGSPPVTITETQTFTETFQAMGGAGLEPATSCL